MILLSAVAIVALFALGHYLITPFLTKTPMGFANTFEEKVKTVVGSLSRLSDDAIDTRHLLVTEGSDALHVKISDADEPPLGSVDNEYVAVEERVSVKLLDNHESQKLVTAGAIPAGVDVYSADGGKVQAEPAVAGIYFLIGRSETAATDEDQLINVLPLARPIKVVVIAALTSTNGTAAGAADLAALKTEAEKIGDDVRALGAALATPALVKVLAE